MIKQTEGLLTLYKCEVTGSIQSAGDAGKYTGQFKPTIILPSFNE
ncbi:hypothetical protein [Staphylococcus caprae]|nr:hypothetical protein [Staphylococcus caprae]